MRLFISKIFGLIILFFFATFTYTQEVESVPVIIQEIKSSNRSFFNVPPSLVNSLTGVKYAYFPSGNQDLVDYAVRNPNAIDVLIFSDIIEYLNQDFLFDFLAWTPSQKEDLSKVINNPCEVVSVYFNQGEFGDNLGAIGRIQGIELGFTFCDGQSYIIKTDFGVSGLTNYSQKYRKHFSKILNLKGQIYNREYEKILKESSLYIDAEELNKRMSKLSLDPIEGVYGLFTKIGNWSADKIYVINEGTRYTAIFLEGDTRLWKKGELKSVFTPTLSEGDFLLEHFMADKSFQKGSAIIKENSIEIILSDSTAKYVKLR